jgi:hypothetical protein
LNTPSNSQSVRHGSVDQGSSDPSEGGSLRLGKSLKKSKILTNSTKVRIKTAPILLAAILLFAGCATQTSVAPGPLGTAQTKLVEARSQTLPTETRITRYFEAAEIAENEAERESHDQPAKQRAEQIYNAAAAEVTVLLVEADGGKYWNHNERIGSSDVSYDVRFQSGEAHGVWSPGFFDQLKRTKKSDHRHLRLWVHGPGFGWYAGWDSTRPAQRSIRAFSRIRLPDHNYAEKAVSILSILLSDGQPDCTLRFSISERSGDC